jgi:hypothetical protein
MARWMGVALEADWPTLGGIWNGLDYDAARQSYRQSLVEGELEIMGGLDAIWPLLVAGESCHVGRGATQGLGRYRLE